MSHGRSWVKTRTNWPEPVPLSYQGQAQDPPPRGPVGVNHDGDDPIGVSRQEPIALAVQGITFVEGEVLARMNPQDRATPALGVHGAAGVGHRRREDGLMVPTHRRGSRLRRFGQ